MPVFHLSRRLWCCSKLQTTNKKCFFTLVFSTLFFATIWVLFHRSPDIEDNLDEKTKAEVIEGLLKLSDIVSKSSKSALGDTSKLYTIDSYMQINEMLLKLGNSGEPSQTGSVTHPDVCQEKYVHEKLTGDYPYFYKGFYNTDCKEAPPFHTVLTVVYNFVHYDKKYYTQIPKIIHAVNEVYPKLKVIVAVPSALRIKAREFTNTRVITASVSDLEGDIWNKLIYRVNTKYVYIGRNAIHFTRFDRLDRLVREIKNLNAVVVAAAYRTLNSGLWSNGCEQSVLRNYTLAYQYGYDTSVRECLLCHHLHGPFVAKTALFQTLPFESDMAATSSFAAFFLAVKRAGKIMVSCPDSMAFITDESQHVTTKEDWAGLAYHYQIERILLSSGELYEFNCDEANTHCKKAVGMALSLCCMKELSDAIKLVLHKCKVIPAITAYIVDLCLNTAEYYQVYFIKSAFFSNIQEEGLLCEIQEGTLMGTMKFNGILPWELDADLALHENNYTAFIDRLKPYFTSRGYKWNQEPRMIQIFTKNWKVELFTQSPMDTETLELQGISGTQINLDGVYVPTSESPGLMTRNRYGAEIYQHVLHWSQTGKSSSWDFYGAKRFPPCPSTNHPGCLDQYIPDGNIMFKIPRP